MAKEPTGALPPRLFGTNGVRGIVNTRQMDSQFALRLGMAIGTFMKGPVMLGTDTRTSSDMLRLACAAGIMAAGFQVLDCGITPTPALQYAVRMRRSAGGVVITASHNPPEFNGIKCIDPDGTEMSRENEEAIEKIYHEGSHARADWTRVGSIEPYLTANEDYVKGVVSRVDSTAIKAANLRVALDCSNGAGALVTPKLLEKLGVRYVTLNADPDGTFPGHFSEPTPENSAQLIKLVSKGGFDFGVIQDGDADRAIFVDDRGRYMYGDRSLALVAHHICQERKGGLVVTTVGSSMCIEDAVRMAGGSVIYTRVGSPVVARVMKERNAVFGGEENGGLIFPEFQYCRDGGMSVAKVLEIVAKRGKMSDLLDGIPAYSQCKTKTSCPDKLKEHVMDKLASEVTGDRVDRTDGVKIFTAKGWVLVRPSGTEPIFRIFSEARTPQEAEELAEAFKSRVEKLVKAKR